VWSSHSYVQEGLKLGYPKEVLENAVDQSEALINQHPSLPSILSLKHLSDRTRLDYHLLRNYVSRVNQNAYKKFSIAKRSGGRRYIFTPDNNLMHLQRWINEHILKKIQPHVSSHAFTKGSSIQKCAIKHCGAKWLIKIDVMDFFESISEIQVFRLSPRRRHKQWRVKRKNKSIPQYSQSLLGYLPQGAATSPLISNLVMKECDEKLALLASKYGLVYTRYSDDMSFSTRSKNLTRTKAKQIIKEVYELLTKAGYRPQLRKTKIVSPGSKKIILGLNVDGSMPRLQKQYKDRIRQHFYYIEKYGLNAHLHNRGFDSVWGFKCHLKGLIDFANMIEPNYAGVLLDRYKKIEWPY